MKTAQELIDELKELNPDMPVRFGNYKSEDAWDIDDCYVETDPNTQEKYFLLEG